MENLISQVQIQVNPKVFLKDPNSSELGKKIVSQSIIMIDEMGLERFTFAKLAKQLETTESSVYRYFESKHKLLIYLTSWYWGWLEYHLVFKTANIPSAKERLKVTIELLCLNVVGNDKLGHMRLDVLNRIVISESSKAYLTKEVDEGNKEGFYAGYKRLVQRISEMVLEINKKYKYSHTLISTIVEGIHHQKYFADHLPTLTDIKQNEKELAAFYNEMAMATICKS